MRTVVLGPDTGVEDIIERRRAAGADLYDEVWEGEYHMAPAPHPFHSDLDQQMAEILGPLARGQGLRMLGPCNIGPDASNFRVPDRSIHRGRPDQAFVPTAELVIEVVSPDDESWAKFDFYAAHDVAEVVIVDGHRRSLDWFALVDDTYQAVDRSEILGVAVAEVVARITWP